MHSIVSVDKEPRLLEILEMMIEKDTDTCIIKAVSQFGLVTLEVNILEFFVKEDMPC
jgi:hypothetical protein